MGRSRKLSTLPLYHPRLWPTWAGIGLLWVLTRLPYRAGMAAGRAIGRLAYLFARKRRRIAEINLQLCFPELSDAERRRLVRRNFEYTGMALIEMGWGWWADNDRIRPLGEIVGLEHLQNTLAQGKGVLLLGAHFTCMEMTGRMLMLHLSFPVTYRRHKNPVIERFLQKARNRRYQRAIERRDVRGMIRAIRSGVPMWYAPDQDFGTKQSVFVPFLGVPAATLTATARIASIARAPVVPVLYVHRPEGGYRIEFSPPLKNFPSGDEIADATRINEIIGEWVRRYPDQYLWVHRRFKSLPEGGRRRYV